MTQFIFISGLRHCLTLSLSFLSFTYTLFPDIFMQIYRDSLCHAIKSRFSLINNNNTTWPDSMSLFITGHISGMSQYAAIKMKYVLQVKHDCYNCYTFYIFPEQYMSKTDIWWFRQSFF